MKFNKVTPEIIAKLQSIVGSGNVLSEEMEVQGYSCDESVMVKHVLPGAVVKPLDTRLVSEIMKLASAYSIPVTPRGAGTGLAGGAVPTAGGIVLSLEKLNHILEIDKANLVAAVESGVTLASLKEALVESGLHYPLSPGELNATIGGNICTNAGGMNAVKSGVSRQHILGLEAVMANGEIIRTGGKYVKSASGYDLTQLIAGSEGTLAIVTGLILKLSTKMPVREVLYAPFSSLQAAIDTVPEILQLNQLPNGLEFIEKDIVDIVEKYTGKTMPYNSYPAFLMLFMEGENFDAVVEYFSKVEQICKKHGAAEARMAGSERAKRLLIESREKFYIALKKFAAMEEIDIVVPRSEIARFVARVKDISRKYGIPVVVYGHAGDGNVHLHPICSDVTEMFWKQRLPVLTEEIYRTGIEMGGAVSGEHGIGIAKKAFLLQQLGSEQIKILKGIKKVFDPQWILNPGKIFD